MSVFSTRAAALCLGVGALAACTTRPFDRYMHDGQWVDAARVFTADSALMDDERALYEAGVLYGSPVRPTFDPGRAHGLLLRLLVRFPGTKYRAEATDRLALVDALLTARDSISSQQKAVEIRIGELTAELQRLRVVLDSVQAQTDVLRKNTARLEADVRERDEQLRALRLELRQLKEIDLKPRVPPHRPR